MDGIIDSMDMSLNKLGEIVKACRLSPCQEDPLEKSMATHTSILAWEVPWIRGAWWATIHGVTEETKITE